MIECQIHLSSGCGAALQGYDGLLRFGYTKNRGIYALRVEADGEWQGMTLRAFWHLPDGNAAPSTLVADGLVEVPALITAVPGEGRITFEGTDGTRTLTSADVCYCVAENSGTEDSTLPQPGTPAWQALLDRLKAAVESCLQSKRCVGLSTIKSESSPKVRSWSFVRHSARLPLRMQSSSLWNRDCL